MHPPIRPSAWDGKLEAWTKKVFIWFVVPVGGLLLAYWFIERCECVEYCKDTGGEFVELDTGGRFNPNWTCVCLVEGKKSRTRI